jgi:hypothetical protein
MKFIRLPREAINRCDKPTFSGQLSTRGRQRVGVLPVRVRVLAGLFAMDWGTLQLEAGCPHPVGSS